MTNQLGFGFAAPDPVQKFAPGAFLLRAFAMADEDALLEGVRAVTAASPFRHMTTPGGHSMSVAMSNCGALGWISDRRGYRYSATDPLSSDGAPQSWPSMPDGFLRLARSAADRAGYLDFHPDACLINRYDPGARMSLHQDKDEQDFSAPIVSVSLGLPATFQFGGDARSDKVERILLSHGDIVVWGGSSRTRFHGVLKLKGGDHPLVGPHRINLTFRKAGS